MKNVAGSDIFMFFCPFNEDGFCILFIFPCFIVLALSKRHIFHLFLSLLSLFSQVLRVSTPRFVCWLVGRSRFTFLCFCSLWTHCSNALVTSKMAPAHPHETSVAVYPALFLNVLIGLVHFVLKFKVSV